jgi:2-polyprenyl-6-methoxyphenol hydroxylase-like FAD-dependent oxidoreductase
MQTISTRCCIAGGGPAGMMLGYLLARAGIDCVVLEKWPDFFRDFRGDTIHPSTMDVMHELGILDAFLQLPHNETKQLTVKIGDTDVTIADFSQLNVRCPFIAFIPQWDFLNFIAKQAEKYPSFHLHMETEALDLIIESGRVVGVKAKHKDEEMIIRSELVIGADGRHSLVREKSQLKVDSFGAPMDVLWFRLSRTDTEPKQSFGRIDNGRMMVMLERGDYWQCGFLIRKGGIDKIREEGLQAFRNQIIELVPRLSDRVNSITSWDEVKLLTVTIDRLQTWHRPGLLCIGDAAHAMSPMGGVGINLAIQDAIAAANILTPAFLNHTLSEKELAAVQKRRELPTKIIQRMQVFFQSRVIDRVLGSKKRPSVPFVLKLFQWFPFLRRVPAYIIGIGFRPEHIKKD